MTLKIYYRLCLAIALLPVVLGLGGYAGLALLGCEGNEGSGIHSCRHASAEVGDVFGAMLLAGVFGVAFFWLLAGALALLGALYARARRSRADAAGP